MEIGQYYIILSKTGGVYSGKYLGREGCYQKFDEIKQWNVRNHFWKDLKYDFGIHARRISETIHLR